jgi:hypothetical protein
MYEEGSGAMTNRERLNTIGACHDAVEWAGKYKTPKAAWKACQRGDWMLWLIGKTSGPPDSDSRRKLVLVAAQCAELALPFARDEETRAICESTIQTCYAYAAGEAELTDVRSAYAAAAYAAAVYAAAYASAYAAYAAYAAADASAAYAAAYASAYAAADAAAYAAADAAARADARSKILAACADIVRDNYPESPL